MKTVCEKIPLKASSIKADRLLWKFLHLAKKIGQSTQANVYISKLVRLKGQAKCESKLKNYCGAMNFQKV